MSTHFGRSWPGMPNHLEETCPCPKAPCGLVDAATVDQTCPQHSWDACKTMRQSHDSERCPANA